MSVITNSCLITNSSNFLMKNVSTNDIVFSTEVFKFHCNSIDQMKDYC